MMTVMFATRDGARWIEQTLESFCALVPPVGGFRIVAVDNGSRDGTDAILARYAVRLPLVLLHEARAGKNCALNTGLAHVAGDLVAFTDDDVLVAPDWLLELRRVADAHPGFAMFGGRIEPAWPALPPDWLLDAINPAMVYAVTGTAHRDGEIAPRLIFGPNMMVRADRFAAGLRFDEAIGPDGTSRYAMGSETALLLELEARGERAWFANACCVHHIVRREQLDPAWIAGRYYRSGRSKGRRLYAEYHGPLFCGLPRYVWRSCADAAWLWLQAHLGGSRRARFASRLALARWHGIVSEYRRCRASEARGG